MAKKCTIDEIRRRFSEVGCEFLADEYVSMRTKIKYRCSCGEIAYNTPEKVLSNGQRCRKCRSKKLQEKAQRHPYEYVKSVFEKGGCELLSKEYRNGKQKLKYICECGKEAEISFTKFRVGQRCSECKIRKIKEKLTGPNNPLWDHTKTMEERIKDRKYPEYKAWRKSVYERDNYTCQRCDEVGGTINAHHIESYSKNPELRTEISNGITLCEDCHKKFHRDFYKNDSTDEDFQVFMYGAYDEPWYAGEEDVDAYIEYLESIVQEN